MKKAAVIPVGALTEAQVARMIALELEDHGFTVTDKLENGIIAAVFIAKESEDLTDILPSVKESIPCYCCLTATDGAALSNAVVIRRPIDPQRLCDELLRIRERGIGTDIEFFNDSVLYRGERIYMSRTELALLKLLNQNKGRPVSREAAYEAVFGGKGVKNSVDVYIRYLRKKLDEHFDERMIITVRDKGYMLK